MAKFLTMILMSLVLFVALIYVANQLGDGITRRQRAQVSLEYARGQAQAMVIEAQGQARRNNSPHRDQLCPTPLGSIGNLGIDGTSNRGLNDCRCHSAEPAPAGRAADLLSTICKLTGQGSLAGFERWPWRYLYSGSLAT